MLDIMQCSSIINSIILPGITTRSQMTLLETHPIFSALFSIICYALQPLKLLHKLEKRSEDKLATKFSRTKQAADVARAVVFDDKFLSIEENQIHCLSEKRDHVTQVFWNLRQQNLKILLTHSKLRRKGIYFRSHSYNNPSTSRAKTGCHNHKHPGQQG
jgi:hypothetical protein